MTRIREASHTVACIDEYCAHYRSVFHNVRHFEQFTQLELGMLAETKRKSLAALGQDGAGRPSSLAPFSRQRRLVDGGAAGHSAPAHAGGFGWTALCALYR